jgi:hypothetical protein
LTPRMISMSSVRPEIRSIRRSVRPQEHGVGYERERDSIGGRQRRRMGDEQRKLT